MIEIILAFLIENKEWLFSGIGITIVAFILKKKSSKLIISIEQKSNRGSTNIIGSNNEVVGNASKKDNNPKS